MTLPDKPAIDTESEHPDLPGFRTWRGVYLFVLACFGGCLLFLWLFTRWFAQ